jgi:hypothetical protein
MVRYFAAVSLKVCCVIATAYFAHAPTAPPRRTRGSPRLPLPSPGAPSSPLAPVGGRCVFGCEKDRRLGSDASPAHAHSSSLNKPRGGGRRQSAPVAASGPQSSWASVPVARGRPAQRWYLRDTELGCRGRRHGCLLNTTAGRRGGGSAPLRQSRPCCCLPLRASWPGERARRRGGWSKRANLGSTDGKASEGSTHHGSLARTAGSQARKRTTAAVPALVPPGAVSFGACERGRRVRL